MSEERPPAGVAAFVRNGWQFSPEYSLHPADSRRNRRIYVPHARSVLSGSSRTSLRIAPRTDHRNHQNDGQRSKEPTKHQYDFDAGTILGFLRGYDLIDHVKLNIETNHATLATHTMQHELHAARINGVLGSVDANQGDLLLGWDTDQFPTDLYETTLVMYEILKNDDLH